MNRRPLIRDTDVVYSCVDKKGSVVRFALQPAIDSRESPLWTEQPRFQCLVVYARPSDPGNEVYRSCLSADGAPGGEGFHRDGWLNYLAAGEPGRMR